MIPYTKEKDLLLDRLNSAHYVISYNPPGDGNCQFSVICECIRNIGLNRSVETGRKDVVDYLTNNPHYQNFTELDWTSYVMEMAQDGTFGDHITLQAAADIYNVEFVVISSLGQAATAVISPSQSVPLLQFTIGHYAEGDGEHYVVLTDDQVWGEMLDCISHNAHESPSTLIDINQQPLSSTLSHTDQRFPPTKLADIDLTSFASTTPELDQTSISVGIDQPPLQCTDQQPSTPTSPDMNLSNPPVTSVDNDSPQGSSTIPDDPPKCASTYINQSLTSTLTTNSDRLLLPSTSSHPPCRLNADMLELIITHSLAMYPFMRQSLRLVSRYFLDVVDRYPLPRIYIPELFPPENTNNIVSVRKIMRMKGRSGSAVMELHRLINHPKWINAWLIIIACQYGWFDISRIFWKKN